MYGYYPLIGSTDQRHCKGVGKSLCRSEAL
jgi:hypothetical protein